MKKHMLKLVGVIFLAALIEIMMTACPNGTTNGTSEPPVILVPGTSLTEKLQWVKTNAASNTQYDITVNGTESIGPQSLYYSGKNNVIIRITGSFGGERLVSLTGNGSLFAIAPHVTLILDRNVTLEGHSVNYGHSLVQVSGGMLIMNDGAKITGNNAEGVYVHSNGSFIMNGGEISGNTRHGLFLEDGTVIINNGKISGNTDNTWTWSGGVLIWSGTLTMNNGEISGNTGRLGGGLCISSGTFTMNNGKISGNTAEGGGVFLMDGTFTMNNGEISGNTASNDHDCGGGVYVSNGTFTMSGGEISGNTASYSGGGVDVYRGSFTMNGGEISGNIASGYYGYGGGVDIGEGTFYIINGTIYGSNEAMVSLRNIADIGAGLHISSYVIAQCGRFSGSEWISLDNLTTTDDTIKVVNGVLQ